LKQINGEDNDDLYFSNLHNGTHFHLPHVYVNRDNAFVCVILVRLRGTSHDSCFLHK